MRLGGVPAAPAAGARAPAAPPHTPPLPEQCPPVLEHPPLHPPEHPSGRAPRMRAQPPWSSRLAPARHRSAALRAEVGPFEYGAGHRPRGRARRPRALRCRRRTSWTTTRCPTSGRAWTARSSACTATWLRRAGVGAVRSVLVVESGRAPAVFLTRRAAPRPVAAADLQCGGSARRPCSQGRPGAGSVGGPRRHPDPVCQGGRRRRGARGRAGGAPAHLPGVLALRGGRAGLHRRRRARPGLPGRDQHRAV